MNNKHTILPDGSAFFVADISIPRWKIIIKKLKMREWWLRKPRYHCPRCNKGLYSYWEGNDIEGHGTDYCNRCARILLSENAPNNACTKTSLSAVGNAGANAKSTQAINGSENNQAGL